MKTTEPSAARGWLDVEAAVSAFEDAHAREGSADPAAFCPPPGHPLHIPIAAELVRAGLEFSAHTGSPRPLESYRAAFPALFADAAALTGPAFEEYRLRTAAGLPATPAEYRSRYGVDTSGWSVVPGRTDVITVVPRVPAVAATDAGLEAGRFPEPGEVVVGFRLVGELGRGAFARVYVAEEVGLAGRFVALKVSQKLAAEAQTLARLQHTNIVPVYSVHRAGAFQAICMPFLGACTLADVIRGLRDYGSVPLTAEGLVNTLAARRNDSTLIDRPKATTVPPPVAAGPLAALGKKTHLAAALGIVAGIADGLAHAHDRGIIHRDIKPANVLLTDDGVPMLLDFNLAAGEGIASAVGGTPSHMAPEQLDAVSGLPAVVDARSDIYALGLLLYELLTGCPSHPVPESGTVSRFAALRQARTTLPEPARVWNPAVTPAVDAIVARCTAPDPADRYPSARDLREDILRHLADLPLKHAREPSLRERLGKKLRRNPWAKSLPFMAAVVLVVAAAGYAAYSFRTRQVERADAVNTFRDFRESGAAARLAVYAPDPDPDRRDAGAQQIRAALSPYGLPDSDAWQWSPRFLRLDPASRRRFREDAGELLVHLARVDVLRSATVPEPQRQSVLEEAAAWCDRAARVYPDDARGIAAWYAAKIRGTGDVPDARVPVYLRAGDAIVRREFRTAVELLTAADRAAAKEPAYWDLLGRCHFELGEYHAAVACYTAGVALQPQENERFYLGRGNARFALGEFTAATADYDAALAVRPDDPVLLRDRAQARLASGDHAGAVADLSRSLELAPGHTRAYFVRALAHARGKNLDAAKRDREEGLKRAPGDEASWVSRGVAKIAADPPGAVADFDAALALNPASRQAMQNKANVLSSRLNRPDEAVELLGKLIAAHPDYLPARAGRGVLLARLGKRPEALADAAAVLARNPPPLLRYQLAGVFALTSRSHPADRAEAVKLVASALRDKEGLRFVGTDPDLAPLRDDPEFRRIVESAQSLDKATGSN